RAAHAEPRDPRQGSLASDATVGGYSAEFAGAGLRPSRAISAEPVGVTMRNPGGHLPARPEAQLGQDVFDVYLHCPFGNHQPLGDFPIAQAVSYQTSNFSLANSEPIRSR